MKTLKLFLLFVLLQTSFLSVAQNIDKKEFMVTEIIVKPDSYEELKTIDWTELTSIFENSAANDSIKVGVELREMNLIKKNGDSLTINEMSVMVADIAKNSEDLKQKIEKSTYRMIQVLEKWQN